jgi:hypothetical protein
VRAVTPASGPDLAANNFVIRKNTCLKAGDAINLWAVSGYTLRNVTIADNTIALANQQRRLAINQPAYQGISLTWDAITPLNGDFDSVLIERNSITAEKDADTISPSVSGGIMLQAQGNISNVTVRNNSIANMPNHGIRVTSYLPEARATGISITNNKIIDSGNDTGTNGYRYRIAILLAYALQNIEVSNNAISDTAVPFGGDLAIWAHPTAGSANVCIRNNPLTTADSNATYRLDIGGDGLSCL